MGSTKEIEGATEAAGQTGAVDSPDPAGPADPADELDPWDAAEEAVEELKAALADVGLVLPSLGINASALMPWLVLVELGGARPDVVRGIAEAIKRGTGK
ncbi:hypothetical protein [Streptomyces sp. NPDC093109]|uniref:hypothetical protein n=1 Tax=Streptomyces sp. NPDC093109 TaxID=3154977 RepID=UPI00344C59C9